MKWFAAVSILGLVSASCLRPRFTVPSPVVLRERETDQFLLRMHPAAGPVQLQAALARIGGTVIRPLPIVPGLYQVHSRMLAEEAWARLGRSEGVLAVRPNRFIYPTSSTADGLYPKQWSLENTGQVIKGTIQGTPGADIAVEGAWYFSKGSGFLVAVIDSGLRLDHLDLVDRIAVNQAELGSDPAVDSDLNGYPGDVSGWNFRPTASQLTDIEMGITPPFIGQPNLSSPMHGTAVASILGAEGGNAMTDGNGNLVFDGGMRGVCWYARLLPLQVMEVKAGVLRGDVASAIAAIHYCEGLGVRVSCNSWGAYATIDGSGSYVPASLADAGPSVEEAGTWDFQDLYDAIENIGNTTDHLFVASAGQSPTGTGVDLGTTPFVPAAFDLGNIISVTGVDYDDGVRPDFNHGGAEVDLAAPAILLIAADGSTTDDYRFVGGTSFATPQVAGAAALLWSYKGNQANAATIKSELLSAARKVSSFLLDPSTDTVTEGVLHVRGAFPLHAFIAPKNDLQTLIDIVKKMIELGLIQIEEDR